MTRVAVLGLGSIGRRHAENLINLGVVVTAHDPGPMAGRTAEGLGIKLLHNRNEALANADAVIVASPNENHLDDVQAAFDAGCHVLCEKPVAHLISTDVLALPKLFESKNLVFACGFNLRFNAAILKARNWIKDGRIGAVLWARFIQSSYLPDWRPGADYRHNYAADPVTGGVIFDVIHEIDLIRFLLGEAEAIGAVSRNSGMLDIPSEDIADLVFRHEKGIVSTVHLDYVTRPSMRTFDIAGTGGRVHVSIPDRAFKAWDSEGNLADDIVEYGSHSEDYVAEMKNFLASIQGTEAPVASGEAGIKALVAAIAARRLCNLPEAAA